MKVAPAFQTSLLFAGTFQNKRKINKGATARNRIKGVDEFYTLGRFYFVLAVAPLLVF